MAWRHWSRVTYPETYPATLSTPAAALRPCGRETRPGRGRRHCALLDSPAFAREAVVRRDLERKDLGSAETRPTLQPGTSSLDQGAPLARLRAIPDRMAFG